MCKEVADVTVSANCVKNIQTFIILEINYMIRKYSNLMVTLDYSWYFEVV